MGKTAIEWTDETVNPIRARLLEQGTEQPAGPVGHYCEKISPGCGRCYASRMQRRFQMPTFEKQRLGENVKLELAETALRDVLKRRASRKWFWCSMTDLFGHWVPAEWIDRCFATMAVTRRHVHQILTKRPERMAEHVGAYQADCQTREAGKRLAEWAGGFFREDERAVLFEQSAGGWWEDQHMPNVWFGTSVENRDELHRIDALRACPAAVRFLSCEPLIEDLSLIHI